MQMHEELKDGYLFVTGNTSYPSREAVVVLPPSFSLAVIKFIFCVVFRHF